MTTISQKVELVLGAKDSGAAKGLKNIELGAKAAEKASNLLSGALKGAAVFFAAKFTTSYVKEIATLVDSTSKLARTVGSSTEAISRLRFVFESVGLGAGKLESVLNSFEKKRAQALRGLSESVRGFEMLGISLDDLRNLGTEDLFEKIAANLETVGDQTERQSRLSVAFEDSFRGMEEVLGKGSKRFQELKADAEKFSLVITGKDGIVGEEFSQALTNIGASFQKVFGGIMLHVLPALTSAMNGLATAISSVADAMNLVEVRSESYLRKAVAVAERELEVAKAGRGGNPFGSNVSGSTGARVVDPVAVQKAEDELKRLRDLLKEVRAERDNVFGGPGGGLIGLPGGPPPGSYQPPPDRQLTPEQKAEAARNAQFAPPTVGAAPLQGPPAPTLEPGFVDGLTASWDRLVQTMGTANAVGQQFGSLVGGAISGVSDILVDMIATGESSSEMWKKLGASVASELAKIAIQYAIIGAIKGASGISFAHGGVGGGDGHDEPPMRIHKFGHGGMAGGVAGGASVAIYGESSRREAFVPLQDGRNIPVRIEGSGGSSVQTVYYINAIDTKSMAQALQQHGAIYRGAVRDGLAGQGGDRRIAKRAVR